MKWSLWNSAGSQQQSGEGSGLLPPPHQSQAVNLLFPQGLSRSIKRFHLFLKRLGKGLFL